MKLPGFITRLIFRRPPVTPWKSPLRDSDKLRLTAAWFDFDDRVKGIKNDDVQRDLRAIADRLENLDRDVLIRLLARWHAYEVCPTSARTPHPDDENVKPTSEWTRLMNDTEDVLREV